MVKIDPIIAVKDVNASAEWYQALFECHRTHGGDEFAVLLNSVNNEVLLCLHKWSEHAHPTMQNPNNAPGKGLILYFKVDNFKKIRQNVDDLGYPVEEDIHKNANSMKMEFSLRDPDGYYLIVTEYHDYT